MDRDLVKLQQTVGQLATALRQALESVDKLSDRVGELERVERAHALEESRASLRRGSQPHKGPGFY